MARRSVLIHTHRCGGGCGKQAFGCSEISCRYNDWIVCPDCLEKERKKWQAKVEDEKREQGIAGKAFSYEQFAAAAGSLDELAALSGLSIGFLEALKDCDAKGIEPLPTDLCKAAAALNIPVESFYRQALLF